MKMEDILTIALPVYNRTRYIKSALDCAVNQSVKCRVLVIDNNSPHDEFKKIVDSYNNPLIKYVRTEETVHMTDNFNNCFKYCDTPWVTILHDDDLLHTQYVELAQMLLKRHNKLGGFAVLNHVGQEEWKTGYDRISFTNDIKVVKEPFFYFAMLTPFPGVMLHKDIALELGGFDRRFYPFEDLDFWYRYCSKVPVLLVNQELAFYRISPSQDTVDAINAMINGAYNFRRKILKEGRHNNLLSRLALEDSRISNINYFRMAYPEIEIAEDLVNRQTMKRAEKLFKLPYLLKLVRYYRRKISFDNINL